MQRARTSERNFGRYTGPTAATISALLPGSQRPDSQGRRRLRGIRHGHGGRPDSASLVIQDWPEGGLEVWPESYWPGFPLSQADVFQSYEV